MQFAILLHISSVASALAADAPPAELTPRVFVHIRPEARTNPNFVADQSDGVFSVTQSLKAGLAMKHGIFEGVVDFQGTNGWGSEHHR